MVCVQRTLTSTHTHPFTLTHTPVNYQDELKAKFLHRQMRPVECIKRVLLCTSWAGKMQMDSSPSASSEEPQGVGLRLAYYTQLPVVPAVADLHLQLPCHTWEHTGFVDSISGMLSLRVSQNKEPSRVLNSDTEVTITCVLDCLKKKVGKERERKTERSCRNKRKSRQSLTPPFKGTGFANLGTFSLCCFCF